jgi:hypothetical protein
MPIPIPHPSRPPGRPARAAVLALSSLICVFALSACGGGGGGGGDTKPEVASLPSSKAPSGPASGAAEPSSSATKGRPQERIDDTPAEDAALIQAWDDCLLDHGAPVSKGAGVKGAPKTPGEPIPEAARKACEDKLPLLPPEEDPAQNPHYRDDSVADVKCLRDHGVKVHLTSDTSVFANGLSWAFDSGQGSGPADMSKIEDQCMIQSFGGNK